MIAALALVFLAPVQDVWERTTKDLFPIDSVRARGRIDLRIGPSLDNSRYTILPAKISADLKIVPADEAMMTLRSSPDIPRAKRVSCRVTSDGRGL